jgi:hypothetical protein
MLNFPTTTIINNPARKGEFAAQPQLFGAASRYKVAPIHTRFEAVEWFVWDAERPGADGKPEVVRQCATLIEAIHGLDTDTEEAVEMANEAAVERAAERAASSLTIPHDGEECYTSSASAHARLLKGW